MYLNVTYVNFFCCNTLTPQGKRNSNAAWCFVFVLKTVMIVKVVCDPFSRLAISRGF